MDYSLLVGVKKERFEVMASPNESDKLLGSRDSMATISAPNGRITDHALGRSVASFNSPTVSSMVHVNTGSVSSTPSGTKLNFLDAHVCGKSSFFKNTCGFSTLIFFCF